MGRFEKMDSMRMLMKREACKEDEMMVFDWDKAAAMIRDTKCKEAYAWLENDWFTTGGCIWQNGYPKKAPGTYLASFWARPMIELDGVEMPCYKLLRDANGCTAKSVWPDSAMRILNAGKGTRTENGGDGDA